MKKFDSILKALNLDPSVKLLIANQASENSSTESIALNWCLDNGFEFVSVSVSSSSLQDLAGSSAAGLLDESEKTGIERVREALECNMWSECNMKDVSVRTAEMMMNFEREEEEAELEDENIAKEGLNGQDATSNVESTQAIATDEKMAEENKDPFEMEGDFNEDDLDNFEAILEQVSKVRQEAVCYAI